MEFSYVMAISCQPASPAQVVYACKGTEPANQNSIPSILHESHLSKSAFVLAKHIMHTKIRKFIGELREKRIREPCCCHFCGCACSFLLTISLSIGIVRYGTFFTLMANKQFLMASFRQFHFAAIS